MSLVMRGAGVGVGRGDGDGLGVWANAFSGALDTAKPAAPAAGRSLTKLRRLIELRFDFFIDSSNKLLSLTLGLLKRRGASCQLALLLSRNSVLHLHNFGFGSSIH